MRPGPPACAGGRGGRRALCCVRDGPGAHGAGPLRPSDGGAATVRKGTRAQAAAPPTVNGQAPTTHPGRRRHAPPRQARGIRRTPTRAQAAAPPTSTARRPPRTRAGTGTPRPGKRAAYGVHRRVRRQRPRRRQQPGAHHAPGQAQARPAGGRPGGCGLPIGRGPRPVSGRGRGVRRTGAPPPHRQPADGSATAYGARAAGARTRHMHGGRRARDRAHGRPTGGARTVCHGPVAGRGQRMGRWRLGRVLGPGVASAIQGPSPLGSRTPSSSQV